MLCRSDFLSVCFRNEHLNTTSLQIEEMFLDRYVGGRRCVFFVGQGVNDWACACCGSSLDDSLYQELRSAYSLHNTEIPVVDLSEQPQFYCPHCDIIELFSAYLSIGSYKEWVLALNVEKVDGELVVGPPPRTRDEALSACSFVDSSPQDSIQIGTVPVAIQKSGGRGALEFFSEYTGRAHTYVLVVGGSSKVPLGNSLLEKAVEEVKDVPELRYKAPLIIYSPVRTLHSVRSSVLNYEAYFNETSTGITTYPDIVRALGLPDQGPGRRLDGVSTCVQDLQGALDQTRHEMGINMGVSVSDRIACIERELEELKGLLQDKVES